MHPIATIADVHAVEAEMSYQQRVPTRTLFAQLSETANRYTAQPAISFQIKSGVKDPAETLDWGALLKRVAQAANLFRSLGVTEKDTVAYVLPNCNEAVLTLLGGATAGIVCPINPTLAAEQIGAILRECNAKVVVTLAPFPKADVAQKIDAALHLAPNVQTVLQVDLKRYLHPPISWIVSVIRPKVPKTHTANIADFSDEIRRQPEQLSFVETGQDRVAAYFHTGGTTGMPKLAQHRFSGMIYNGWCPEFQIISQQDVLICPLPMFHVLAAYPVFMTCLCTGAHFVMPTPQGYRGDGVIQNFWKLIERYNVSFMVTVPTAIAKLIQVPINADVSSLKYALSGSAPLPVDLFRRFEAVTGLSILEGYGMTEATCLVSINPLKGEHKIGSVGLPFPYSDVKILRCNKDGTINHACATDEIGEICVANPGVYVGHTYVDPDKNIGLFAGGTHLRTGDLGRIDADGYIWITGRAKDVIIRGGHNIDPALIEEGLAMHPDVAFSGAIGQPDAYAGEIPCAYVELVAGSRISAAELLDFAAAHISERAAIPKHLEILAELPKSAVGKVLKNELRKLAVARVFNATLKEAGLSATVDRVYEDTKRGLVACLSHEGGEINEAGVQEALGKFFTPWEWSKPA